MTLSQQSLVSLAVPVVAIHNTGTVNCCELSSSEKGLEHEQVHLEAGREVIYLNRIEFLQIFFP